MSPYHVVRTKRWPLFPLVRARRAICLWWPWRRIPTVYIPQGRGDATPWVDSTLAHEKVHVAQWLSLGRLGFTLRYATRRGRLALEAEAFAASVRWHTERGLTPVGSATWLDKYAHVLSRRYGLGMSVDECKSAIRGWLQ